MYVSSPEFILTIANDGECYEMFLTACKKRFFGEEWHVNGILTKVRIDLRHLNNNEEIEYEVGAMRDARIYLNNRYYSHFLTEIAPEYVKSAQKQLEMWEKTRKIV